MRTKGLRDKLIDFILENVPEEVVDGNVTVPLQTIVSVRNTLEEIAEGLEKLAGRKELQGWNYGYWLDRAYPDSWRAFRKLNEICERCQK